MGQLRELVSEVDRTITKQDFSAQAGLLDRMLGVVKGLGLKSIDDLGGDPRAWTLTLLLKVSRQTKVQEDEEKEKARQASLERLARIWMALGDQRRASGALTAAGKERAAAALLESTGDWEAEVELLRTFGDHLKAARVLEEHDRIDEALEAYVAAGDTASRLRLLARSGNEAGFIEILNELTPEDAEKAAIEHGALDAWAKVLTERQDWSALARLYQAHGQHEIAARAWEEAGEWRRSMKAYLTAGDGEGHARMLEKLVEERIEQKDLLGAGRTLISLGKFDRAADLAAEKHPEQAHQWYVEGGYPEKALELARREARKAEGHDDYDARATWLERAGDRVSAATLWEGMGKLERAQGLYEQAHAWEPAARCAEALKKNEEAVELYYRAGLKDEAERLKLHGT